MQEPHMNRRYVLISPCRNEAQYMRRTLDTVVAQSVPPALWVIVDDGSQDETAEGPQNLVPVKPGEVPPEPRRHQL